MSNKKVKPNPTKREKKVVLTIGGSDSGGGAGIQADLKTMETLDCFGVSVITAITAQNTKGVQAVYPLPTEQVIKQLDSVFDDFEPDAVKIGMLGTAETIKAVYDYFDQNDTTDNIVLDPVMVSTSGHRLIEEDAVTELKRLIDDGIVFITTPNIPEAEILFDVKITDEESYLAFAKEISSDLRKYPVLYLKGGHGRTFFKNNECIDLLCFSLDRTAYMFRKPFIGKENENYHGTGCALSTALACFLAHNYPPLEMARSAQQYVHLAIKQSPALVGGGSRVLQHRYHWTIKKFPSRY